MVELVKEHGRNIKKIAAIFGGDRTEEKVQTKINNIRFAMMKNKAIWDERFMTMSSARASRSMLAKQENISHM